MNHKRSACRWWRHWRSNHVRVSDVLAATLSALQGLRRHTWDAVMQVARQRTRCNAGSMPLETGGEDASSAAATSATDLRENAQLQVTIVQQTSESSTCSSLLSLDCSVQHPDPASMEPTQSCSETVKSQSIDGTEEREDVKDIDTATLAASLPTVAPAETICPEAESTTCSNGTSPHSCSDHTSSSSQPPAIFPQGEDEQSTEQAMTTACGSASVRPCRYGRSDMLHPLREYRRVIPPQFSFSQFESIIDYECSEFDIARARSKRVRAWLTRKQELLGIKLLYRSWGNATAPHEVWVNITAFLARPPGPQDLTSRMECQSQLDDDQSSSRRTSQESIDIRLSIDGDSALSTGSMAVLWQNLSCYMSGLEE
eukprot:gnl/TRDRNA2_/TRDRNA2_202500_c0_seq1.p1 gnl/TRDRNA2_/TRDRNA2_202500_c0~~gnl/TRDRNA2_/TRDRNA2_202500_c0_seq1.p1  ORF type:complete len:403 (+),score=38.61 gnl/TRDRNA2_/TRDRNA2_202500_c0_seq1:97-1209(+)